MVFTRFTIIIIFSITFSFTLCDDFYNDFGSKLTFKPYELVDLVREEQLGKNNLEVEHNKRFVPFYWSSKHANNSIGNGTII